METITLEYDTQDIVIQKLIEAILAAGAIEKGRQKSGKSATLQALDDIRNGNVTRCKDFDDYLEKIHQ